MLQGTNIGRHFSRALEALEPMLQARIARKRRKKMPPPLHRASTDPSFLARARSSFASQIRESGTRDIAPNFPLVLDKLRTM